MALITQAQKDNTDHVLTVIRSEFQIAQNDQEDNRDLSVEDTKFAQDHDGQWDERGRTARKNLPRYSINMIAPAINTVVGNQRNSRVTAKLRSKRDADQKQTELIQGLVANTFDENNFNDIKDIAFDEILNGGYGGWRISTAFESDHSFDQRIVITPIRSANTSMWFDTLAKNYDKSDARWGAIVEDMSINTFNAQWPDHIVSDFTLRDYDGDSSCNSWLREGKVRVGEFFFKIPKKTKIFLLSDGRVVDAEEVKPVLDKLVAKGITVEREREVDGVDVYRYVTNGISILEGPELWAGKFIPIVPVFGKEIWIAGRPVIQGMVRFSKDAQRIYNYATSANIEAVAMTPKDPYFVTAKQIAGYRDEYENFNLNPGQFMPYHVDPEAPGPPQRGGAPSPQTALIQQVEQARLDVQATIGIFGPNLGNAPGLQSGVAIEKQQNKGDIGTAVYSSNLLKSIRYTAEISVDLLPKISDTPREMRIVKEDGSTEVVQVNEPMVDEFGQPIINPETGKPVIINDLSIGEFDVMVDTGPLFATQRSEMVDLLIRLSDANPLFAQLSTDLIAKGMDFPEANELQSRVRKVMIQQGTIQPTEEEIEELGLNQQQEPNPIDTATTDALQAQAAKDQADAQKKVAETDKIRSDTTANLVKNNQTTVQTEGDILNNLKAQAELGIPINLTNHNIRVGQQNIIEEGQDDLKPKLTPEEQQLAQFLAQNPQFS